MQLSADDADCTLVFDISKAHVKRIEARNISKDNVDVLLMLKDVKSAFTSIGISDRNTLSKATLYTISATIDVALEQINLHGEKLDKKEKIIIEKFMNITIDFMKKHNKSLSAKRLPIKGVLESLTKLSNKYTYRTKNVQNTINLYKNK